MTTKECPNCHEITVTRICPYCRHEVEPVNNPLPTEPAKVESEPTASKVAIECAKELFDKGCLHSGKIYRTSKIIEDAINKAMREGK